MPSEQVDGNDGDGEESFYDLRFNSFLSDIDEQALRDAATFGECTHPTRQRYHTRFRVWETTITPVVNHTARQGPSSGTTRRSLP